MKKPDFFCVLLVCYDTRVLLVLNVFSEDGFLTKCCSGDKILDLPLNRCVDIPKGRSSTKTIIPPRMIRDVFTGLSTEHYHLEIYQGMY